MANNTIRFNVKLNVDGKDVIISASTSAKELQKNLSSARSASENLGRSLINFNQFTQVFSNINSSIAGLKSSMDAFTSVYNNAVQAETKLVTVMRQRMGANEAMIGSVNATIAAQTKLGVVGGTVQRSGAQQIATFLNEADSLKVLIPAMNDLLTQQRGMNATSEDAVSVANLMGKAMQGQTSALKRVGITFTDAQAEVMKYGTEQQRAAMLAQIITDNVGHMNAALAATDAGKVKQASNEFGGLMKRIGEVLSPYQTLINQFAMFGMAVSSVLQVASAMTALGRAVGVTTIITKAATIAQGSFAAMLKLLRASATGAAVSMQTLRAGIAGTIISLGLIGIAYEALSAIVGVVVDKLGLFGSTADKAAGSVDALAAANEDAKQQVKNARAELEKNISATKNFHGTKKQEEAMVEKLNNTYGDTLGYFSSVHEWYNALVKDSKAYCDQMIIEAENRKLADQAAEIDQKIYDTRYDSNGKLKRYSKRREQKPVYDVDQFGNVTVKRFDDIEGTSDLDKANASIRNLAKQRNAIRDRMERNNKRLQNINVPVKGSTERPQASGGTGGGTTTKRGTRNNTTEEVLPKGSIADLNRQVETLRKQRERLTDTADIAAVDKQIRQLTDDIDALNMGARQVGMKDSLKEMGLDGFSASGLVGNAGKASLAGPFAEPLKIPAIDSEEFTNSLKHLSDTLQKTADDGAQALQDMADATGSINSIAGGSFAQTVDQWKGLGQAMSVTGDAGMGAGASLSLVGQSLQQVAGDGAVAKAGAVMAAIGQLILGFATASAQSASMGPWGWIGFTLAGAATLASIIAQVSSFSTGGIVGGTSYHGDKVPARVNSGEMVLTVAQQKRLFDIANGMAVPKVAAVSPDTSQISSLVAVPAVNVTVDGDIDGTKMKLLVRNVERKYGKIGKQWR